MAAGDADLNSLGVSYIANPCTALLNVASSKTQLLQSQNSVVGNDTAIADELVWLYETLRRRMAGARRRCDRAETSPDRSMTSVSLPSSVVTVGFWNAVPGPEHGTEGLVQGAPCTRVAAGNRSFLKFPTSQDRPNGV